MEKAIADKILDAQERFYNDPAYTCLWEELQLRNREFWSLMEELSPRQRAVIDDYMGLIWEMKRRLLCYAIEKTEL